MNKIKGIVNASWFKAAIAGGIATLLLFQGDKFYAGIAYGYAVSEAPDAWDSLTVTPVGS